MKIRNFIQYATHYAKREWDRVRSHEEKVAFGREIPVSIPPEILWPEVEKVFTDSTGSSIWPNSLSELHAEKLSDGQIVTATYKLLAFRKSVEYRIQNYHPGRSLDYEATENHPLKGGARVEVLPHTGGCILSWKGQYSYKGLSLPGLYFKTLYSETFIILLDRNLREFARKQGSQTLATHAAS